MPKKTETTTAPVALKIRDRVKELRKVRAGDLVEHPGNWRTHPKAQLDALRGAMEEIGFAGAVLTRRLASGKLQIIDGHARAELDPDAKLPCLVTDLSAKEAELLLATFDPIGAMAGQDDEALKKLLKSVDVQDAALKKMLAELGGGAVVKEGATDPDEVPETGWHRKGKIKRGDLFILGEHRLMCGDSTSAKDFAKLLGGSSAQLVATSPPYNAGIKYATHDDKMSSSAYMAFMRAVADRCTESLMAGGAIGWNVGVSPKSEPIEHANTLAAAGLKFQRQIIWANAGVTLPTWQWTKKARGYFPNYCHELIYIYSKGELKVGEAIDVDETYCNDVWWITQGNATADLPKGRSKEGKSAAHPAAFPVAIPLGLVRHLAAAGEFVLEPFSGSGTTLIACEQLSRRGMGMEIDPKYCGLAIERWRRFTGKEPERG